MTTFTFLFFSDFHLCIEPNRANVLELWSRQSRSKIDTLKRLGTQAKQLGLKSLINPASFEPEQLSGVERFFQKWFSRVDRIVFTGDVCTSGLPTDIDAATRMFSRLQKTVSDIDESEKLCDSLFIFPGNHDRYKNNFAFPNSNLFDLRFEKYMPNFEKKVGHWVEEKEGCVLIFVFADWSIRSKLDVFPQYYFGRGKVYPDVLSELINRSKELQEKYPTGKLVWLSHFAPYDCGSNLALEEANDFVAAALKQNVIGFHNGHTHQPIADYLEGIPLICNGSGTASDVSPDNCVQIVQYEFKRKKLSIISTNYYWNENNQSFSATNNSAKVLSPII